LPETLDGTYEQSLRRIDKQKRDFACRLFQCLVVSKRPLLVEELGELFAIQPDVGTIPTFDARCRPENPEEFVLSACSTLVAIVNNGDQKIVQFSHFSVREYLTSDRIAISEHVSRFQVLPRPSHALLARACLSVLLHLDDGIVRDEIQDCPLASYAAQYWVDHAQFEDVASEIQHIMECLFDKDKPYFAVWRRVYDIDNSYRFPVISQPVPLYYAALCGFRHLAEHLVDAHPQDVNARGGRHVTPLHAALEEGHSGLAMLLLDRAADIESRGSRSWTPLHIASYRGYADVVSSLIDRGADPNTEAYNLETPLYLASEYGRRDAAKLLLKHGADANHQNAYGSTPLRVAWQGGHVYNVRLLLDYGADAKSPNNRGNSLLHVVLQDNTYGITPPVFSLPTFLEHRLDVVTLLLEHGADANYPDNNGETPLHIVLRRGLIDIVRLFLHHGADANIPDKRGASPLHVVLQEDRRNDIDTLVSCCPSDYPDGPEEPNPALLEHRSDIVMLLLDHGADANHPDNHSETRVEYERRAAQGAGPTRH
jgi:ankyrin repeat protein